MALGGDLVSKDRRLVVSDRAVAEGAIRISCFGEVSLATCGTRGWHEDEQIVLTHIEIFKVLRNL
jgi:hypothetical protein